MSSPLAVLGGLFDPVHKGHVAAAVFALDYLGLERLKMIPCHVPNHKAMPLTQARDRLAMLEIATAIEPRIEVDPIELQSDRVSYTVDTLSTLAQSHGTIVFVLGVDSFNSLPKWHEWRSLFELCHFLVLPRPGSVLSSETLGAVDGSARIASSVEELFTDPRGRILQASGFNVDMSSSAVRQHLLAGLDISAQLDPGVISYIEDNGLYRN